MRPRQPNEGRNNAPKSADAVAALCHGRKNYAAPWPPSSVYNAHLSEPLEVVGPKAEQDLHAVVLVQPHDAHIAHPNLKDARRESEETHSEEFLD